MAKKKMNTPEAVLENGTLTEINELTIKDFISRAKKLAKLYSVTSDRKFKLKDYKTRGTSDLAKEDKPVSEKYLQLGIQALAGMQDKLYAQDRWSLLVIFQAMDAAGKDGAIKHVMSGINPQGCEVTSFKSPSVEELDHDYLWRCMKKLPERGRIGIFNRSYYEEVLVVRVHEEYLQGQKLPPRLVTESIWDNRMSDIRNFETYLNNNGIRIVKIFLNVSKKEQKKRFLERIDKPEKNWKFSKIDVAERKYWKKYMEAYEDMIRKTSTAKSPWYVIPADNKKYARILIAAAILNALNSMKLSYPVVTEEQHAELLRLKQELTGEKDEKMQTEE